MSREWLEYRTSDLIKRGFLAIGDGYRAKNNELSVMGIPFARAGNINDGFQFNDTDYFPTSDLTKVGEKISRPGDVVFTSKGTVGRFAFVQESTPRFVYSPQLCYWRSLDLNFIHPRFLFYWMQGQEFWAQAASVKGQTDMADYVSLGDQRQMKITLPHIEEQKSIAGILGALDDRIEANRRMNATLEAMAAALFQSWFVDFDPVVAKAAGRAPWGMDAETAALFPDGFEASALGEVPRGWGVRSLKELFPNDGNCVLTGPFGSNLHASDYRSEGVPLILVKHVNNGQIIEDNMPLVGQHKLSELGRYRLLTGDIVFTRVGAVGRSAYIHPRHEGWLISGQTLRVRVPDKKVLDPRYLAQVYLEPTFIDMVESHALGTTRPSLNTSILESFKFLVPSSQVQIVFSRFASMIDAQFQANLEQSRTLAALRDILLPKLLSGEVRVGAVV